VHEGFGLPCLEAMASGVPVAAARRAALPETVGDAGLLAEPAAPDEFSAAVLAAALDEPLRRELIAKGRERAATYSWSRTAAQTDRAIGELLSSAPRLRSDPSRRVLE
jgi:glycosyltransferase involved in cell wall biosynthesis